MPTLNFTVEGQKLTVTRPDFIIVANSVNYLKANFNWIKKEEWTNLFIYGQFSWNNLNYFVDFQKKGNNFYIPWEVIKSPGFTVSLFGTKTELDQEEKEYKVVKQITTNVLPFKVEQSGNLQGTLGDENSNELDVWTIANLALIKSEEALKKVEITQSEVEILLNNFQKNLEKINAAAALKEEFELYKNQVKDKFTTIENSLKQIIVDYKAAIDNAVLELRENDLVEINTEINNLKEKDIEFQKKIETLFDKDSNSSIEINRINHKIDEINNSLKQIIEDYQTAIDNAVLELRENDLVEINTEINNLKESINTNKADIFSLGEKLQEVEKRANRVIVKEDTDFIQYINLNLISEYNDGKIDLETNEIIEDDTYFFSNYIDTNGNLYFCSNSNNFNVFCYVKEIQTDESTGEELVSYLLDSTFSVVDTNYFQAPTNINSIRISAEKMSQPFILEIGIRYEEDYSYYRFDSELTSAIQKQIDDSIGALLDAEY